MRTCVALVMLFVAVAIPTTPGGIAAASVFVVSLVAAAVRHQGRGHCVATKSRGKLYD